MQCDLCLCTEITTIPFLCGFCLFAFFFHTVGASGRCYVSFFQGCMVPGTMGFGSVIELPWSYHGRSTWNVTLVGMGWEGSRGMGLLGSIGSYAVGKEMNVGCNGIWESYIVGQNCIVFAVSDGKCKEDLVKRGGLRHLRRKRVYMFNNRPEKDLNDFLTCALWRKVSVIMKDVKEKGILIKRHAIFRAWITVFKNRWEAVLCRLR